MAEPRSAHRGLAACTIISRNYLSHARILGKSFLSHEPAGRFYLLVVDGLPPDVEAGFPARLVDRRELDLPHLFEMCFKYDVTELCTAVKPSFLSALLEKYGEEEVVYFDPDIWIARPLTELKVALGTAGILLIPHLLEPIPADGRKPGDQDILIAGAYNLGFVGVRDSAEVHRFLAWWESRLRNDCRVDPSNGLMVDQKWMDLVPGLFPSARIFRDQTHNVAYWNYHERRLERNGGRFLVNGSPLGFFHFSGFDPRRPETFSKHQSRVEPGSDPALQALLDLYAHWQMENGFEACSRWEYGYARFSNGVRLHPILRQLYLGLDEEARARFGDPFRVDGDGSFLRWATRPAAGRGEMSPFLERIRRLRYDVVTAFPDGRGRDHLAFVEWARTQGAREMGYDSQLIEVEPGVSLPARDDHLRERVAVATAGPAPDGGASPADGGTSASSRAARRDAAEPPSAEGIDGVNVCGYLRSESGLGSAARGYIRALRAAGVPLALKDLSHLTVNRSEDPSLDAFDAEHPHGVNLVCVNADQHFVVKPHLEPFFAEGYNIGIWAWELPRFPEKWHDRFSEYDEVWVGTSFIANALTPVSPIPVVRMLPVLTTAGGASRERGRARLGARSDEFVFLFIFDFHSYFERKNPLAVVRAFKRAFGPGEPARLVLKCVNGEAATDELALLAAEADGGRIVVHDGYWSAREMRDLMAACDAYVSLHRSEGTGLTIADAMAVGRPVIATGWSGNMDFMTVANSYPVEYSLIELSEDVGPYRAGEVWADPDVEHAAEMVRRVFECREEAADRGRRAAADMSAYSAENVGRMAAQRLRTIGEIRRQRRATPRSRASVLPLSYGDVVRRVREAVAAAVPGNETVIVLSKGDPELVDLDGHPAWHFPRNEDGDYAGYYPEDGGTAIAHLEMLRTAGARAVVFPCTAFWWFRHYEKFFRHLEGRYRRTWNDEACIIYDLAPRGPAGGRAVGNGLLARLLAWSGRRGPADSRASLRDEVSRLRERLFGHAGRPQETAAHTEERLQEFATRTDGRLQELAANTDERLRRLAARRSEEAARLDALARSTDERLQELATRVDGRAADRDEALEGAAARVDELERRAARERQELLTRLAHLETRLSKTAGILHEEARRAGERAEERAEEALRASLDRLSIGSEERLAGLTERVGGLTERVDGLTGLLDRLTGQFEPLARRADRQEERIRRLASDVTRLRAFSRRRASELAKAAEQDRTRVEDLGRAVSRLAGRLDARPFMAEDAFGTEGEPTEPMGYAVDPASGGGSSGVPRSFADLFRGSEEFIARRQRVYLPFFERRERVVDLGCGRGEFLRLLAEAGIRATGVELDASLVERGSAAGLDVVREDALEYLERQPPDSLDAVFSAQFVEHLAPADLPVLLELVVSRLGRGGLFIAETVNPESHEALKVFHVDRTHERPIFPQVFLHLCRSAGFPSARIFYPTAGGFTQERFAEAGEYAVIAYS